MSWPVMGQPLLLNPAGADGVDSLGSVQWDCIPSCTGFAWDLALQPLLKVLAASVLGARIHSGAGSMLIWRETACGSEHSTLRSAGGKCVVTRRAARKDLALESLWFFRSCLLFCVRLRTKPTQAAAPSAGPARTWRAMLCNTSLSRSFNRHCLDYVRELINIKWI